MGDESLARLHERIDELAKTLNQGMTEVKVGLARMEAAMPKRPCPELQQLQRELAAHLAEHEKARDRLWQAALKLLAPSAAAGALAGWLTGQKF